MEDDVLQGLDLAEMLEAAGASVVGPIGALEEAIGLLRTRTFSAAIIDFRLRQFNAVPIGQELHERGIPFLIYTGYDCLGVLPQHWRGCRVIIKPADVKDLIRTVAALVRWRLLTGQSAAGEK